MLNSLGKDTPWRILWPHVVSNPRRIFKALCLDGINGFSTTTDHLSWGSRHDPHRDIQKSAHRFLTVSTCFKHIYSYKIAETWGYHCDPFKRKSLKTWGSDSLSKPIQRSHGSWYIWDQDHSRQLPEIHPSPIGIAPLRNKDKVPDLIPEKCRDFQKVCAKPHWLEHSKKLKKTNLVGAWTIPFKKYECCQIENLSQMKIPNIFETPSI